MPDLRLTEIWIYPVKALGGIRLRSSRVLKKGLQYDRRWMLIDHEGNFMTQRTLPVLALFKLAFNPDHLTITFRDHSTVLGLASPQVQSPFPTKVWDDVVTVNEVSTQLSSWFSDRLSFGCKLVSFPEENLRPVDPDFAIHHDQVSLADAFPFMIIGETSLDDLNKRLKQPLPMNRFRPNLVFSGGQPYEEDTWKNFRIGTNRFAGVKPCSRCPVPTVNQDTGEKGFEPLATLATYRKHNGKVYFGQNAIALDHHRIFEGDEIILE